MSHATLAGLGAARATSDTHAGYVNITVAHYATEGRVNQAGGVMPVQRATHFYKFYQVEGSFVTL